MLTVGLGDGGGREMRFLAAISRGVTDTIVLWHLLCMEVHRPDLSFLGNAKSK